MSPKNFGVVPNPPKFVAVFLFLPWRNFFALDLCVRIESFCIFHLQPKMLFSTLECQQLISFSKLSRASHSHQYHISATVPLFASHSPKNHWQKRKNFLGINFDPHKSFFFSPSLLLLAFAAPHQSRCGLKQREREREREKERQKPTLSTVI